MSQALTHTHHSSGSVKFHTHTSLSFPDLPLLKSRDLGFSSLSLRLSM
jgi:hypothetical protein